MPGQDLGSPVPFYAALLQPALSPFLPPTAGGGDARRQRERAAALEQLAAELAPVVEAALNDTRQPLEELLAEVEALIPPGTSEAGAARRAAGGAWQQAGEPCGGSPAADMPRLPSPGACGARAMRGLPAGLPACLPGLSCPALLCRGGSHPGRPGLLD